MRRNLTRVLALLLALVFVARLVPTAFAGEDVRIHDTACSEKWGLRAAMTGAVEDTGKFGVTGPD